MNVSKFTKVMNGLVARQLPTLYSEKKAKSVGCKIEDMRSRFCFL